MQKLWGGVRNGRHAHHASLGGGGQADSEAIRCVAGAQEGAFPEIPPITAIRPAFIAGRIALGFLDDVATPSEGQTLDPDTCSSRFAAGGPVESHVIEALDVSDRPYIWDL